MTKIGLKTPSPSNPGLSLAEASLCTWQGLYKAPSREDPSVIQRLMVNASDGLERPIHTSEEREQATITDLKKYFTLGGCCGPERPIHSYEQREQSTITDLKKYFTLGGCLVLKGHCIWTSYNNRKYFTLGGCCGPERPLCTGRESQQWSWLFDRIFPSGRVLWSWKAWRVRLCCLWEGLWLTEMELCSGLPYKGERQVPGCVFGEFKLILRRYSMEPSDWPGRWCLQADFGHSFAQIWVLTLNGSWTKSFQGNSIKLGGRVLHDVALPCVQRLSFATLGDWVHPMYVRVTQLPSCLDVGWCLQVHLLGKHPPKVKYFFQAVIIACSLCSYECIGLSRPQHPPKVKYFFQAVIVACSLCSYVCIGLSGPNTLPKWNIFSKLLL